MHSFSYQNMIFDNILDLLSSGAGTYSFLLISPLTLILYSVIVEKNKGTKDMMNMVIF
jgi:hypothetical protein